MNKISLILFTFTITPIFTAPPSSQPWPKLKNYDIWGSPTNKLDTSKTNKLEELVYNSNNENSTRNGKGKSGFQIILLNMLITMFFCLHIKFINKHMFNNCSNDIKRFSINHVKSKILSM